MSIEYIRNFYNVPAKIGTRVKYEGKLGTIKGTKNAYLKILLDGEKKTKCYHPTYNIEYITENN